MLRRKEIIAQISRDAQSLIPVEWARLIAKQAQCPPETEPDLCLELSAKGTTVALAGEVVTNPSRAMFMHKISKIKADADRCRSFPLIIAPYLSPDERSLCHDHNVFFIDLSGNQWIAVEGVLIEREGFKNRFPEARAGRNPFSDKASLVIRELMAKYGVSRRVRELADLLALSPGYVSKIANELEERGYIRRSPEGLHLISPKELLADWVSRYSIRDNRQHRYFLAAVSVDEVLGQMKKLHPPESEYALTAQAGANLVYQYAAYDVVHIYVKDRRMRDIFTESLQLQPVERGENVILMEPRYRKSAFYQSRKIKGLNVVSDLQLYLDLFHYPKRGREQAEKLFEVKLAPLFHKQDEA